MPSTNRQTAQDDDHGVVDDRHAELGGYTANFVTMREAIDHAPLLAGLPDDRCQCPHWGYVFKGSITFQFGGHSETYGEGDAFYAPPGHIPINAAGTEYLQFSPTDALRATESVIMRNLRQTMGSDASNQT